MYLREKLVKALRIKNVVLTVLAVLHLLMDIDSLTSLAGIYWGDWDTVLHAKRTVPSVIGLIVSLAVLLLTGASRRLIGDAQFFSGYFEGDLDGVVSCGDLAEATGRSSSVIRLKLRIARLLYMKRFSLVRQNGETAALLESKTALCACKGCGARIEKRIYFTGICPYCGGSDLFAKVLSGDRFYSISSTVKAVRRKPEYYQGKRLTEKKVWFVTLFCLSIAVSVMLFCLMAGAARHLNDEQYIVQEIFKPENHASRRIITNRLINEMSWSFVCICGLIPAALSRLGRLRSLAAAQACSECFAKSDKPFVRAAALPGITGKAGSDRKRLRSVSRAIRLGYLQHCTLEKHEEPEVALAKQITKDACPNCAAPIVGAADLHYTCRYCGSRIMDAVQKK